VSCVSGLSALIVYAVNLIEFTLKLNKYATSQQLKNENSSVTTLVTYSLMSHHCVLKQVHCHII